MPATQGLHSTPGCLDDVRVVEVGDQRGEYCAMLLAGQGADVIKVEPPSGSPSRGIGPFYQDVRDPNRSLFFWTYNHAKRGVVIDLTRHEERNFYAALVRGADVILVATGSRTPVLWNPWVSDGACVISVGACRPTQREMDPELVARGRVCAVRSTTDHGRRDRHPETGSRR